MRAPKYVFTTRKNGPDTVLYCDGERIGVVIFSSGNWWFSLDDYRGLSFKRPYATQDACIDAAKWGWRGKRMGGKG